MKKRILIFLMIAAMCLGTVLLAACKKSDASPAESVYGGKYLSTYDGENDPDIEIDGKLDEDVWQNKQWFRNTYTNNLDGSMPYLNVTSFTTQYGIYMGVKLEDSNLTYIGEFTRFQNSLIEFMYYVYNVGDERELNPANDEDYIMRRWFFMDLAGEGYGTGERMKRAVSVDGELNSGATTSATMELFLPWSELPIDLPTDEDGYRVVPENVYILPLYHAILPGQTSEQRMSMQFVPFGHMNNFWKFDENGFTDADASGAVLGDSDTGLTKSGCWDLENESRGEVSISSGVEQSWIYAKGIYATNFVAETTIIPYGKLTTDSRFQGAYCGFNLLSSSDISYNPTVDFTSMSEGVNGTKTVSTIDLRTISTEGGWTQKVVGSLPNRYASTQEGVTLRMIKQGGNLYYFVNGEYLGMEYVDFLAGDVFCGLFSNNTQVTFKDYSFAVLDESEVRDLLAESHVYTVSAETATRGGSISCAPGAVYEGGSAQITVTLESGYGISSLLVNGKEMIADFIAHAEAGVYTLTDITENVEVEVSFARLTGASRFTGVAKQYGTGVSAEMTLIGLDDANRAFKYVVDIDGSGYALDVVPGRYYVEVLNGDIGSVDDNHRLTYDMARAAKVDLTADLHLEFDLFAARNFVYDATTGTLTTVTSDLVYGASHIALDEKCNFISQADGSFVIGMNVSAWQCKYPNVGFSVKDAKGHSVEFYANDTAGIRLLFGYSWNGVAENLGIGADAFQMADSSRKTCEVALAYDAGEDTFYVILNGIGSAKLTRSEINAHIRSNATSSEYRFSDYLGDGPYTVEVCSWQTEPVSGRKSSEPLLTVTDLFAMTNETDVRNYITAHPLLIAKNFGYDEDGNLVSSSTSKAYGLSYVKFTDDHYRVSGDFDISAYVEAFDSYWPCIGLGIEDANGNMVQFYAGDTGTIRLLDGVTWNPKDYAASAFQKSGTTATARLRLHYTAATETYTFYVNDVQVVSVTSAELQAHFGFGTALGAPLRLMLVGWDITPMNAAAPHDPIIKISDVRISIG